MTRGQPIGATCEARLSLVESAAMPPDVVLGELGSSVDGLSDQEAGTRWTRCGPNAIRLHRASALRVLGRQIGSPLLLLLAGTAAVSVFVGDAVNASIIAVILLLGVGLGFTNEYRAERTASRLHDRIRHTTVVVRDGAPTEVDVTRLVPGDVVRLKLGQVVPADLRLIAVNGLECNESIVSGESAAVRKRAETSTGASTVTDLPNCALMGTVVTAGTAEAVVVATGSDAEFGRIARGLGEREPETSFQKGLRRFSLLLMRVATVLSGAILITNLLLGRGLLDSVQFALAIAVGITPQLLPAVVSTSLAAGSRTLAKAKVLVKRLVCIEDLGDVDLLITDKTGTLTEGHITFDEALDPRGAQQPDVLRLALLASDVGIGPDGTVAGGNEMDHAIAVAAPQEVISGLGNSPRLAERPFDHVRMLTSVVIGGPGPTRTLVVKGAPEAVLQRCVGPVDGTSETVLQALFARGARVVAVATREVAGDAQAPLEIGPQDEAGLTLAGFVTFTDRPKSDAAAALVRLAELGVGVKLATGDNPLVAETVCRQLGLEPAGTLTGVEVEQMDDAALTTAAEQATIFARIAPEQKARVVRLLRRNGHAVAFLGDGVNDALALHAADVAISVDTATDVAKDAADVILLDKGLDVLADGIHGGRRIFANTIKYVMMGTSSNFGNMFSAAGASAVLDFLPMLPGQILLNNLLYDASQLTIPTDRVDEAQLRRPSHWDIGFIRRFMLFFGPISSVFDFLTFAVLLGVLHAGPEEFRTGWFIESLATQTLIVLAIRTRKVPFWRSRPSTPLLVGVFSAVSVGFVLPLTPVGPMLGFTALPAEFYLALILMIMAYLALIEFGKRWFYSAAAPEISPPPRGREHRVQRRAARFTLPHLK